MFQSTEQKKTKEKIVLGNEAIALGALEAGVQFVASYPGTPSTEITAYLAKYACKYLFHVEWSTNEKVAFEAAYGASLSGFRSLVGTKHLGMNVLSDSLLTSAYAGVKAGLVIACVDDTHPYSSQNAMDSRYYCQLAHIPCIEPSTIMEAKNLTKLAFRVSEEYSLPVVIRVTQRIAHARGTVKIESISKYEKRFAPKFEKDKIRFVLLPKIAFERKKWLFQQVEKIQHDTKNFKTEIIFDSGNKLGIIGVGIGASYAKYITEELGLDKIQIIRLNLSYPLPKNMLINFIKNVDEVLVFEDGDPIVERGLRNLLSIERITRMVRGKDDKTVESIGELDPDKIIDALSKLRIINLKKNSKLDIRTVTRLGGLCAGCPHMASYYVINEVLKSMEGSIVVGDRGCYNQGAKYPLEALDICMNMGASIGIAYGLAKTGMKKPIVAVIGDSTFFHAGLPALANALYNDAKFTIIIFDNGWISMTGQQPSLSSGVKATGETALKFYPEKIAKALGASFIKVINPFYIDRAKIILSEALKQKETSIIVFRHECALQEGKRLKNEDKKRAHLHIDYNKCATCKLCLSKTGCQALIFSDGKMGIDELNCTGCGLCKNICPCNAIK